MRRRLQRHRAAIAAVALAVIAAVFALLAVDVHAWQTTVARDDIRFRALPAHEKLWRPDTILPGDPASLLLGTGNAMAYRHALQYFWYTRAGNNPETNENAPAVRASAQNRMQSLIGTAPTAQQRSDAANLLGVLVVTAPTPGGDRGAVTQILARAAQYFQLAISLNPSNFDAKQNLELVLRLRRPGKGKFGRDARAGYGSGRGRGLVVRGSGY
jgi:hypothetical protein